MIEFGLIGEKLSHSYSKPIHNMLADYSYELISLSPGEMREFMRKKEFRGINVTIPYKKDVLPFCDVLSQTVRRIGSANTIVNENGRLHAHNTDYQGFLYMAERAGVAFRGKKALILGTGGTSLTARAVVADEGAREIVVVSRTGDVNYQNISDHFDSEVIINTTPAGMFPKNGEKLVSAADFPNLSGVIDVIYNPLRTPLLIEAEALGVPCANGLAMLVSQAKYAAEHFLSEKIGDSKTELALGRMLKDTYNLVLIGMPGCGKTAIGRACAEILGREFIDADDLIAEKTGVPIPEFFAKYGEEKFRETETGIIAEVGKRSGLVISTGGGAVTRNENYIPLKQNGVIIHIERDANLLETAGRPLSAGTGALEKMLRKRLPLYQKFADAAVANDASVEEAAKRTIEVFYENTRD